MSTHRVTTKAQLMLEIEDGWLIINQAIDSLSKAQMTTLRDGEGWTVKDHIAHMTAWERSALYFLQGKPRHEGLGVEESVYLSEDEDSINAAIYARQQSLTLPEVLADFRAVHSQLLTALQPLTDSELMLPYRHFLPDEPGEGEGPPGINVIYGNSAHHYHEHLAWMRALVE